MAEKNVKFYKTKDGTVVYCKDEVARQQIEQLQGIWEAIEELPDGQAVSAQVAIHTTEIAALQNGKANINGSYDSMTVGMSKNVEATSEISGTSLYRPTAGNADVADGVARTLKICGNTTQWDQLVPNREEKSQSNYFGPIHNGTFPCVNGHKYYIKIYAKSDVTNNVLFLIGTPSAFGSDYCVVTSPTTDYKAYSYIREFYGSTNNNNALKLAIAYSGTASFKDCQLFDLTSKFGAGNEPSSPEVVEAWLQNNIGLQTYYPYNAGKLLAAKLLGLKTVGFNQWDEEWEVGGIDNNTGQPSQTGVGIRSKNYCKCFGNTQYYGAGSPDGKQIYWYDAEKNYIGTVLMNNSAISPANACYFKFRTGSTYGTTYNNDICINLHYTNGRDGEYEPYEEHNYDFDTSKVYGKLNGEGNLVQVFPDGLKSAGSVRDELTINSGVAKAIKRVSSVDLGSKNYQYDSSGFYFTLSGSSAPSSSSVLGNILCALYKTVAFNNYAESNKSVSLSASKILMITDNSYTDAATFKTAMNGVMLNYGLAEPAEYTNLVYRDNGADVPLLDYFSGVILVDNYGTEEQIVESPTNGEPNSCAATLDILYGANAADFMDAANNGAFVSKASLDALCNTLGSALGGTLTSTWNSSEGHYDFTFTPATRQIENQENNE